jgi:glycosyltransferase involved in cell wall biosynthesis
LVKKQKPEAISCHNLLFLPMAVVLSRIHRAKLIYEPHELETEKTGLTNKAKIFLRPIEKYFIKYAHKVIVVCEPIMDWYKEKYNLNNIFTLKNVPYNPILQNKKTDSHNILKTEFNISDNDVLFIYQGLITKERGVDYLLDIFSEVNENKKIVFMGYGDKIDKVKAASVVRKNIFYQPAVPIDEIIKYSSSADVGVHFISGNITLSYAYSMPNKFFEYLIAGLPVLVSSNLKYLPSIILENDLGWVIEHDNKEALISFINNLTPAQIQSKMNAVKNYAATIGWQFEEPMLKKIYDA